VLLALAAVAAVRHAKDLAGTAKPTSAMQTVDSLANGYWHDPWDPPDYDDEPSDSVWINGILSGPLTNAKVSSLEEAFRDLCTQLPHRLVFLFDGLDRLSSVEQFAQVIQSDVASIKRAGAGLVVVGPQRLRPARDSEVVGRFDEFHLHGASSLQRAAERDFLRRVLRSRIHVDILPDEPAEFLVRGSGGLVRDLITLTRTTVEEAYASGDETVSLSHAQTASERFGRGLLLSATSEMGLRLSELVPRMVGSAKVPASSAIPAFAISSEVDIELLLARLIIEVPGVPVRYIPHPAVSSVLSRRDSK
jgi:hypothetical protein